MPVIVANDVAYQLAAAVVLSLHLRLAGQRQAHVDVGTHDPAVAVVQVADSHRPVALQREARRVLVAALYPGVLGPADRQRSAAADCQRYRPVHWVLSVRRLPGVPAVPPEPRQPQPLGRAGDRVLGRVHRAQPHVGVVVGTEGGERAGRGPAVLLDRPGDRERDAAERTPDVRLLLLHLQIDLDALDVVVVLALRVRHHLVVVASPLAHGRVLERAGQRDQCPTLLVPVGRHRVARAELRDVAIVRPLGRVAAGVGALVLPESGGVERQRVLVLLPPVVVPQEETEVRRVAAGFSARILDDVVAR